MDNSLVVIKDSIIRVNKQLEFTDRFLKNIEPRLIPYRKKNKWGFANQKGEIVIPCIYDFVDDFYEGFARVGMKSKSYTYFSFSFIDEKGGEITPTIYDECYNFNDGYALVLRRMKSNEYNFPIVDCMYPRLKCGFINIKGEEIVPLIYSSGYSFNQGVAKLENAWDNKIENWKQYFIDKSLNIIELKNRYNRESKFDDGISPVSLCGSHKYGYINIFGEEIFQCIYYKTLAFREGFGIVLNEENNELNKFFLNTSMKEPFPFKWDDAHGFSDGVSRVRRNDKYGYIDKTGSEILPCTFQDAGDFHEGLAFVVNNSKYGFIDKSGEIVLPCIFEKVGDFENGFAPVLNIQGTGKWSFIDKDGKVLTPFIYDRIFSYGDEYNKVFSFQEEMAMVIRSNHIGFINDSGVEIIPCKYENLDSYDPIWGRETDRIFEHRHKRLKGFSNGYAWVIDKGEWGKIDKMGNEFWED